MKKYNFILQITLVCSAVFMAVVVLWWTILPSVQVARHYTVIRNLSTYTADTLSQKPLLFGPYTYAQEELRVHLLYTILETYGQSPAPSGIVELMIKQVYDISTHQTLSTEDYLAIARGYNYLARMNLTDTRYLESSRANYERALALWPDSPVVINEYAMVLVGLHRTDEAIVLLEHLRDQNPSLNDTYFYLGIAEYARDESLYASALSTLEQSFSTNTMFNPEMAVGVYHNIFLTAYKKGDIASFVTATKRLVTLDGGEKDLYMAILRDVEKTGTLPNLKLKK